MRRTWVWVALAALAAAPALAKDAPWKGQWIWRQAAERERNDYLYARRTFELAAVPKKAPARITADSRYKLWVNGRFVGRGPARSDPDWLYYDRFDLAPYLTRGRNVIAVLVDHYGDPTFQYVPAPAGLLFDAEIGGDRIVSDGSWKVHRADSYRQDLPKIDLQLPAMEEFDGRKEPVGWTGAEFDDTDWLPGWVLGPAGMPPHVNLVPRDIPQLRESIVEPASLLQVRSVGATEANDAVWYRMHHEPLEAAEQDAVTGAEPGKPWPAGSPVTVRVGAHPVALVIDMGREMLGFPRVRVTAPAGTTIDMGYSELLEGGRVTPNRANVHYADRLICRAGEQEYELFTPRAFRYMQIDVRTPEPGQAVTFHQVAQNYSTYPVEYAGHFECSDDTLNAIWKLGRYTAQQCMEDGYTDCPWRERGQWWGDARAEAFTTYYAFGDARLIRKAILQIGQGQFADGITPGVWPAAFDNRRLPDFCLIWVMTLDDYTNWTGDRTLARQLYPKVVKALGWFDKYRDKDGLLRDVPYWVFIDWADLDKAGASTALNAFYVGALQAAGRLADKVGKPAEAADWSRRAAAQSDAMNARMWSERLGAYVDAVHDDGAQSTTVSEQANALCVLYHVAAGAKADRLYALLADGAAVPAGTKIVRCGSPYFSFYWLWSLHSTGRHQQAVDYTRANWKRMLDAGATTAWEVWDQSSSLCHGWSSGPTSLLPAYVLGVRPADEAFRKVGIAPNTAGLDWARGAVPSPRGPVTVDWKKKGDVLELKVALPPRTLCNVKLPGTPRRVTLDGRPAPAGSDLYVTSRKATITAEY